MIICAVLGSVDRLICLMLHGQVLISTICEASFLWIGIQTTQSKMAYNARYNVEVAIERNKLCAMLLQNKFKSILSLWTKDGKQEERHRKKNREKDKEWDVRNVQVRFGQMDMKNNEKHQAWNCIVREGREINLSLFKTQLYCKLYSCHNIVLCIWNDVFRLSDPNCFFFSFICKNETKCISTLKRKEKIKIFEKKIKHWYFKWKETTFSMTKHTVIQ